MSGNNGRPSRRHLAVALVLVAFAAMACTPTTGGGGGGGPATTWSVDPATADPATTADALNPNLAYLPVTTERGALAVVLHGTGAGTGGFTEITSALRRDGYHVIVLRYSASVGTVAACPDTGAATFPDCHRVLRSETTFGAGVADPDGHSYDHPVANIALADSVMNRLLKLLDHLHSVAPDAGWDQFQARSSGSCVDTNPTYGACEADWSKVALLGHSQGAGVALYMASFVPLRAAGLLSGSFDAYLTGPGTAAAAPWTTETGFATPASAIRTLRHVSDGGDERILAVADAVGVSGPEVSAETAPFASNRLLATTTPTCPWDSAQGHNSTAVDLCAPDWVYWDAWRLLAGS
ncbi:MAG: hypothetical protein KDB31_08260 [Microthrixaceae bacterium]|nr:hypothetical protein [Microthrixaceae bacterium]